VYAPFPAVDGTRSHLFSRPDAPPDVDVLDVGVLSSSERAVLDDVAPALTVAETARTRSNGVETVVTPRMVILLNLGAPSMAQAVALVLRHEPIDRQRAA
jgi:DNA-binding NarL/FixJ family response regulator